MLQDGSDDEDNAAAPVVGAKSFGNPGSGFDASSRSFSAGFGFSSPGWAALKSGSASVGEGASSCRAGKVAQEEGSATPGAIDDVDPEL